ncbi:hypothetical protein QQ994_20695 [Pseudomonas asiatica]|uniref:hypothetical protein n=1 Tax=Pseudomonas asiatica TaxID=2219225 RepID=UPI002570D284|nr:hypothetical protein [Pseudomonas asiatica]WJD69018.1 hypothetical protein QQ994_20695 [Pseudomonas asiatica]
MNIWFRHEGYWRLTQAFRLGLPIPLLLLGLGGISLGIADKSSISLKVGAGYLSGGAGVFLAIHALLRLSAWIIDGFKAANKPE